MGGVIKDKAHRLLLPFVFYYVFVVVMKILRAVLAGKFSVDSLSFLNENAVWFSIGPIWFLLALFYVSVLWGLLCKFQVWVRYVLLIALLAIPFCFKEENPFYLCSALLGLPFFVLGRDFKACGGYDWLLRRCRSLSGVWQVVLIVLLAILLSFTAVEGNALSLNKISANPVVFLLNGLLGSLWVLLLAVVLDKKDFSRQFFSKIGRCSLHIMAIHFSMLVFVFNAIAKVGVYFTDANLFENYLCNFIVFIIGTAISYYLGVFVQKYIFDPLKI